MSSGPEIPAPAGYSNPVPFDRSKHRGLGIPPEAAGFASKLHAIYLTHVEIPRAALDYPVVFVREQAGDVAPVALVGVEQHKNLFCTSKGQWSTGRYVPAYVRRYPFFLARIKDNDTNSLICVDAKALSESASPLVNERGETTEAWAPIEKLIQHMDVETKNTQTFCARLNELDLLETFDADFHPNSASMPNASELPKPQRINGLLRVSRKALERLSDENLGALVRDQSLAKIESHLNSLHRFETLLNLYAVAASKSQ
ncbi:MAG: SapC family protein [Pseudomonadota bacterium]